MVKNLLFIAPPAGGKGTYSSELAHNYRYIHISTGDLLREIDQDSELGKQVQDLISQGKLVNDEIVLELLKEKLLTLNENQSFILDGFPRNINQAQKLDILLSELNMKLDLVIELDVPYDICLKRAIGRLNCPNCKAGFNKFFRPSKEENICDHCGATLTSRSDDNEETFKIRYDTYLKSTAPLIDYYKEAEKLIVVDGVNNTMDTIVSVINND